jgi:hypothetical protein
MAITVSRLLFLFLSPRGSGGSGTWICALPSFITFAWDRAAVFQARFRPHGPGPRASGIYLQSASWVGNLVGIGILWVVFRVVHFLGLDVNV